MTERIDHAAEAESALSVIDGVHGTDLSLDEMIAAAQVHATLALVEQQRIANLIAFAQHSGAWEEEMFEVRAEAARGLIATEVTPATPFSDPDQHFDLRPEIKNALGLS